MPKRLAAHRNKSRATNGLSLIEVILSIAIVVIAVSALVTISNAAITGADSSRAATIADQFVRQGLEQIRSYRDNHGFNGLLQWQGTTSALTAAGSPFYYAMPSSDLTGPNAAPAYSTLNKTPQSTTYQINGAAGYYRVVSLSLNSSNNTVTVDVAVYYYYRNNGFRKSEDKTILTNWR